ncbi:unnamed protein product [Closterium sp. Naga37s-1]|nr:unnamed protein product [Closterium sp. Naga37s-1]
MVGTGGACRAAIAANAACRWVAVNGNAWRHVVAMVRREKVEAAGDGVPSKPPSLQPPLAGQPPLPTQSLSPPAPPVSMPPSVPPSVSAPTSYGGVDVAGLAPFIAGTAACMLAFFAVGLLVSLALRCPRLLASVLPTSLLVILIHDADIPDGIAGGRTATSHDDEKSRGLDPATLATFPVVTFRGLAGGSSSGRAGAGCKGESGKDGRGSSAARYQPVRYALPRNEAPAGFLSENRTVGNSDDDISENGLAGKAEPRERSKRVESSAGQRENAAAGRGAEVRGKEEGGLRRGEGTRGGLRGTEGMVVPTGALERTETMVTVVAGAEEAACCAEHSEGGAAECDENDATERGERCATGCDERSAMECDERDATECAVCLSDFADGEQLRCLLPCAHRFHVACIDCWLLSHTTCPVCRTALEPRKDDVALETG